MRPPPSPLPDTPVKVLNCLHRSHFGGAHWRVVWVGEALRTHGIDTTILFPADSDTAYEDLLKARGMPYRRLPLRPLRALRRVLNNLLHAVGLPLQVLRIAALLRREGIDLVHVNSVTNLAPLLAARLAGRPVVWHWNDTLTPRAYAGLVRPLLGHRRGRLVVASHAVTGHYRLGADGFAPMVMPPPVPPEPASGVAPLPFEPAAGEAVIGFVGNLVQPKGGLAFVDTIAELRRRGHSVKGVIVGGRFSGNEAFADRLEQRIADLGLSGHIHMAGFRTDVERWLRRFDALLFPSHTEAAPIVVLQALREGVPLVATRVGNVEEVLAGTGLPVVAVGDVPAMADGLLRLLALSAEERAALSAALRARVTDRFSVAAIAALHRAVYAGLLPAQADTGALPVVRS